MTSFALSNSDFSNLMEASALIDFLGEEAYDAQSLNRVVTLADLEKLKGTLKHDSGDSLYQLTVDWMTTFVPKYSASHPVNKNLGSISKKVNSFSFWGAGVYFVDEVLTLSIGAKTKELEPTLIPLPFDEASSIYKVSGMPAMIQFSWLIENYENQEQKKISLLFFKGFNPKAKGSIKEFQAWVRVKKTDSPTSLHSKAYLALCDENSDLSQFIDGVPTGNTVIAKANKFLSPYYAAKKINRFAFYVTGIDLITRENKEGEKFSQLFVYPDFSKYPSVSIMAADLSNSGNKDGIPAELSSVSVIQFNASESSVLYKKYMMMIDEQEKGIEVSKRKCPVPSAESPWVIEFSAPPKKINNTPPFNVWTNFVPGSLKALMPSFQSLAFYSSAEVAAKMTEASQAIEVEKVDLSSLDTGEDF